QGSQTFAVTLETAGSQTITATDSTGAANGQATVQITPTGAASFVFSTPSSATAGSFTSVTATARDAYGNVVIGYTGTVSFSSSDQKAGLPPSYTFTAADQGSHSFAITFTNPG